MNGSSTQAFQNQQAQPSLQNLSPSQNNVQGSNALNCGN